MPRKTKKQKLLARRKADRKRARELEQIEDLLGEEFENLTEARAALREEQENLKTWRLTVIATYQKRGKRFSRTRKKKRKQSEGSPVKSSVRGTLWEPTKAGVQAKRKKFVERVEEFRDGIPKSFVGPKDKTSEAIEDIPYSPELHGTEEIKNEAIQS